MSRSARRSNSASRSGFRTLRSLRSRHDRRSTAAILSIRGHLDDGCSSPDPRGEGQCFSARRTTGCVYKGRGRSSLLLDDGAALEDIGQVHRPRPTALYWQTQVQVVTQHATEWACSECDEQGTVTGYGEDAVNLSRYLQRVSSWRGTLAKPGRSIFEKRAAHLRAVLGRASPSNEPQNLLVLRATAGELDELAPLIDSARRRRTLRRNARPVADELLASFRSVLGAWDVEQA